jgi:glutathione S-transferase
LHAALLRACNHVSAIGIKGRNIEMAVRVDHGAKRYSIAMTAQAPTTLITIPFSHYCEKARWALDVCKVPYCEQGYLPLFHRRAAKRVGATGSVPALVSGTTVLSDSADIVAWADSQQPGRLLPVDPAQRAQAIELEQLFGKRLGPATRRLAYYWLLQDPKRFVRSIKRGVPAWQSRTFELLRPAVVAAMRRGLKINDDSALRSRAVVDEIFATVTARLQDGRPYLVGKAFSVADLTFAALAAPVLHPPEQPFGGEPPETYPAEPMQIMQAWRTSVAGAFGLRMYKQHRGL